MPATDTLSREIFPGFGLRSLSNMYQPNSAQLAPLRTLHASKRHACPARCLSAWQEWEREAKPWHPWAGEEELRGKPFRQAHATWKGTIQLSKRIII